MKTADVCRKHGISSATFFKWKSKYGGMDVSDARRLKVLEDENRKLKKLLGRDDARRRHAEGPQLKKMVTPVVKRQCCGPPRPAIRGEPAPGVPGDQGGPDLDAVSQRAAG